jgi:S-formylglutathione hydrolase FrmB
LTNLAGLGGAGRRTMARTASENAKRTAEMALDAMHEGNGEHSPAYWVGYLASALERIARDLGDGA